MKSRLYQAYKQTPRRVQTKLGSGLLLALVGITLFAGLYLSISAQTTAAGAEMQIREAERKDLREKIADYRLKLAVLTSAVEMGRRAGEIKFDFPKVEQVLYVPVPGYIPPQPTPISVDMGYSYSPETLINNAYQQSLWDVLTNSVGPDKLQLPGGKEDAP